MRLSYLFNATGITLKYIALVILVPCITAIYYQDYYSILPFVTASLISLSAGFLLNPKNTNGDELNNIKRSEALFIVALSWVMFALIAAIPYLFYNITPINALFEATSGVTTTGATILTDFSQYPKTMFFWRSFSQWLGGMGIIVLFIAILPQFAVAGRQMFVAEAPGPTEQKFTPRIRHTASALWKIYTALTIAEIIILKIAGMPWFDSICNSFSSIATGGLSPNPGGIGGYGCSSYIWIISIFMFISGINYILIFKIATNKKPLDIFKDEEFRYYTGIIAVFSLVTASILYFNNQYNIVDSIRESTFQVISILTTTGFASADFQSWNVDAKILPFILMFIGGCAGSTAGGIKIIRLIFITKYVKREIAKIHHPNAVYPIKINKVTIPSEIIQEMVVFVIFYFLIFAITSIMVILIEKNIALALTGAITTLGNIGPEMGPTGPMTGFDILHPLTKGIMIMNMLVGRLELIPFLAILHPDFWNFKR